MTDGTRARLGDAIVLRLRDALAERYELLDELGRGGMATVYIARDRKHDRDVALKVMDPSLARGVGAARFLREVRIAATLTHPGTVPVFDSGEVDDTFYYVMPLLRGASLRGERRNADLKRRSGGNGRIRSSPGRAPRTGSPFISIHNPKVFEAAAQRSLRPHGAIRPFPQNPAVIRVPSLPSQ